MNYTGYKAKIDRASVEELSDILRAIEADKRLTKAEHIMLEEAVRKRQARFGGYAVTI